jgi:hypothetical protein
MRFPGKCAIPSLLVAVASRAAACPLFGRRTASAVLTTTLVSLGVSGLSHAQSGAPLLQKADLVYQGAFLVPGSANGGSALAYNPANNSLFMSGSDQQDWTAEVSIPQIVNSTNVSDLQTATLLQNYTGALEGKIGQINPSDTNGEVIGGYLVYNGNLYVSAYSFYDSGGTQTGSHFVRPLNLSATGQVKGPFRVGPDPHFTAGYMTLIPPEWQAAFGGPALTGHCCVAIISVQSSGPSVSVFDPSNVGGSSTQVAATRLVGYPDGHQLGPGISTQNNIYNLTTQVNGVVFPRGTSSVLFIGTHGTGPYCYGEASCDGDLAQPYKGNHAYPYVAQIWAYAANDLLAVKNGTKQQYEIQPYAVWDLTLPFTIVPNSNDIGGAAYDPSTQRIYVMQREAVGNYEPVIYVFKVSTAATSKVPNPPTNVNVQ